MYRPSLLLFASITLSNPAHAVEVTPGGELRVNLAADRLDDLYVETPDAEAGLDFLVSRAAFRFETRFSDAWSSRMTLDIRQSYHTTSYETDGGDGLTLADYPSGFETRLLDTYVAWTHKSAGKITAGIQPVCFGVRCTYNGGKDGFYFGGVSENQSLPVWLGASPSREAGISWNKSFGERFNAYLLVGNTAASNKEETHLGKDILTRLELWAVEDKLRLTGSAMLGPRGASGDEFEPTKVMWAGSALAKVWKVRALGEVFSPIEGDITGLGWQANLGGDVGLQGGADHLEILGRVESWDPDFDTEEDSMMAFGGSINLFWEAPEKSSVMTGLFYQVVAPEDLNDAITHTANLQTRLTF